MLRMSMIICITHTVGVVFSVHAESENYLGKVRSQVQ